jgi:hypothetical protein
MHTCFSSTHFLRVPVFQPSAGDPPASGYSGIHGDALDGKILVTKPNLPRPRAFFERNVVHALPTLLEEPVIFLSLASPRRDPEDITFVDPKDGTARTFMARNNESA